LLNLAAALGNAPGINTTAPGTFAVKRRWDDGAFPFLFFLVVLFTWTGGKSDGVGASPQISFSRIRQ
jgi:hypothetical protein